MSVVWWALLPGLVLIGLALQRRFKPLQSVARGLLVSYLTLLIPLATAETYLRCCFAQSENTLTWSTRNWLDRYWQTNTLGYRDREWTPADWEGKTTVMLLGDSFAAGWGINDPADRFGDQLATRLGEGYALLNLAQYGRATPQELALLQAHPLQTPDVVILQYYLNDINYAQLALGLEFKPQPDPAWVNESAVLNFLYFRFLPFTSPQAADARHYDFESYDNPTVWAIHEAELHTFINHIESINARLIVVIFPDMLNPYGSIPYVDRVAQVFEARNQQNIFKLFDAAEAWPLNERIVSNRDTHASVAFNAYVADELYARYFAGAKPP
ncbi:MAG: SGNH/GDSL hydrolase family protein [Phototrophicaceae bacterium]